MPNDSDIPQTSEKSETEKADKSADETSIEASKEGDKVSGTGESKPDEDRSGEKKDTPVLGQETESKSSGRRDNRGEGSPRRPVKLQTGNDKSNKGSSGRDSNKSDKTEQSARHSFLFQRRRQTKETNKS